MFLKWYLNFLLMHPMCVHAFLWMHSCVCVCVRESVHMPALVWFKTLGVLFYCYPFYSFEWSFLIRTAGKLATSKNQPSPSLHPTVLLGFKQVQLKFLHLHTQQVLSLSTEPSLQPYSRTLSCVLFDFKFQKSRQKGVLFISHWLI